MKDVRLFLGHGGFYRRFIQDFSKISKPFSSPLAKDVPFYFSKERVKAFTKLKEALTTTLIPHLPVWGEPVELMCEFFLVCCWGCSRITH